MQLGPGGQQESRCELQHGNAPGACSPKFYHHFSPAAQNCITLFNTKNYINMHNNNKTASRFRYSLLVWFEYLIWVSPPLNLLSGGATCTCQSIPSLSSSKLAISFLLKCPNSYFRFPSITQDELSQSLTETRLDRWGILWRPKTIRADPVTWINQD